MANTFQPLEANSNAAARPLLVVNGGPGLSHAYLLPADVWQQLARQRRVAHQALAIVQAQAPLRERARRLPCAAPHIPPEGRSPSSSESL